MAKNKEDNLTEESFPTQEFTTFVPVVVVDERPVRLVTFTQWASRKNIKPQHMGGIMAHIKDSNRDRSMEDWDKAVSSY